MQLLSSAVPGIQGYQCYCRPCRPMLQPHMIAAQMATSVAVAVAVSAFVFLSATGALLYLVKLQAFSMPMVRSAVAGLECIKCL